MTALLSAVFPAVGVPFANIAPLRARAPVVLVLIALLNVGVAFQLALGRGADQVTTFADGYFVVDPTSRLFLLLVNLIFLGIASYVWTRVHAEPTLQAGIQRYVGCAFVFLAACNLAVLSHHFLAQWAFLEMTTLAAVPLIQHDGHPAAVRAAWKYFLFSSVGLGLAALGFACLGRSMAATGLEPSFFLDGVAQAAQAPPDVWRRLGLVLLFLGFGTKLGLAPMYAWLPETYDAAPPATTALLAAVQFNVALVAVLRILAVYRAADQHMVSTELVALGLLTMVVSALNVIATRNYKKLIAYASMNHAGVIAIGLGIGKDAAYGVIVYVVSNAFIKAILFLTAGKIRSHYETEDMREVAGLIKDLPYSGIFFMVGTFALLGLPPFGSFLGELIVMSALVGGGYITVFVAFSVVLTITFVATGRSMFPMIWGEPKRPANWRSQPFASVVPKVVFLTALVAMGLYLPAPVNSLLRQVATSLGAP